MIETLSLFNPLLLADPSTGAQGAPDLPSKRCDAGKAFPLMLADEGSPVRIHQLQGGKGLVMRLTELGLNQGTEVRIVQRQGSSLVVARGETRIALGAGMASKILVMAV
jgi:ferrous iron transport protein A